MLAVLGLSLGLAGCGRKEPAASTTAPQVLRVSQRNEPGDLDPARVTLPDEFGILRALLEGLLLPGENGGDPRPGAASRYEVSADGLTYTFHLRPGAQWSDGVAVTATHFVDAYRRLLTPATAAPKAAVFYPVRNARAFVSGAVTDFGTVGFQAPDPRTLVVTLEQPTPRFPHTVASGPWLPVRTDVVEKHGRTWTRPEHFVGNGPFTLAEWRPDQRIVARRNPRWHGAAGVKLAELHFVRLDSGDSEDRAYRAGQIEVTMAVPASKVEVYARERPAELHRQPMLETRYLAFNCTRPALRDERVRRALALAIDRAAIVARVLRGGQPVAETFVPPALAGGAGIASAALRFAPDEARRLLAAAGFPGGRDFPRLEVTAWSTSQIPVLEAIQAGWKTELGIDVALATREARVHLSALATGDYDVGFVTAIPDVADAAHVLGDFVSGAPENYPQWRDPEFDAAFARATTLADPTARAAALRDVEALLLRRTPLAPVYFNAKIWLMSPRVRGWQEDGLWGRCYDGIHLVP
ncbi:MAG: peptide ABC transporter substrate-binding protein [Opitutaceae bacterium]|nr:peptide ABC transporter substrate-binding protein [Opitutaceae bacterium]